jgi:hypothetical protein
MPKGRLARDKWRVYDEGFNSFYAERTLPDGKQETHYFNAHCLACAKVEILAQYGGLVDLRGHHNNACGVFLLAMQQAVNAEGKETTQ